MWILLWAKWNWEAFSPIISVSSSNFHSTNRSALVRHSIIGHWSRDSSVCIATGYGLDDRGVGV
jgi:hypothetical protein